MNKVCGVLCFFSAAFCWVWSPTDTYTLTGSIFMCTGYICFSLGKQ